MFNRVCFPQGMITFLKMLLIIYKAMRIVSIIILLDWPEILKMILHIKQVYNTINNETWQCIFSLGQAGHGMGARSIFNIIIRTITLRCLSQFVHCSVNFVLLYSSNAGWSSMPIMVLFKKNSFLILKYFKVFIVYLWI